MVSLVLIAAILSPSFIKLSHALYEHQDLVCLDDSISHVHQTELDCELQKFKLSPQTYFDIVEIVEIKALSETNIYSNYYAFLSDFQKLPFALRGPPQLI